MMVQMHHLWPFLPLHCLRHRLFWPSSTDRYVFVVDGLKEGVRAGLRGARLVGKAVNSVRIQLNTNALGKIVWIETTQGKPAGIPEGAIDRASIAT